MSQPSNINILTSVLIPDSVVKFIRSWWISLVQFHNSISHDCQSVSVLFLSVIVYAYAMVFCAHVRECGLGACFRAFFQRFDNHSGLFPINVHCPYGTQRCVYAVGIQIGKHPKRVIDFEDKNPQDLIL